MFVVGQCKGWVAYLAEVVDVFVVVCAEVELLGKVVVL
jgi:hypothetical protein